MSVPELPPSGWYPDPITPATQRFWDGARWTEQTMPPTVAVAVPPTPVRPGKQAAQQSNGITNAAGLTTGAVVGISVIGEMGGF